MSPLKKVKCGWKWLETTINSIIDAVNERTPASGSGIEVDCYPSNFVIQLNRPGQGSADSSAAQAGGATGAGTASGGGGGGTGADTQLLNSPNGAAQWVQVNIVVDGGIGAPQLRTMYVWAGPLSG